MATLIDNELRKDLKRRLCGRYVGEYVEEVILIHTVDPDGFPHPAVLSYFEVVAVDSRNIQLATYTNSRTTENMRQRPKATLSIFDKHLAFYLKGTARELRHEMQSAPYNSIMGFLVEQVLTDRADPDLEPDAYIERGIRAVNPHIGQRRNHYDAILRELTGMMQ